MSAFSSSTPSQPLRQRVAEYLANTPDRVFIERLGSQNAYQLSDLIQGIADLYGKLQAAGFGAPKTVIGIAMSSSFEWIVANFTGLLHDLVLLPVPEEFTDQQFSSMLAKADVCLVASPSMAARVSMLLPELPVLSRELGWLSQSRHCAHTYRAELQANDVIKLVHTSGTTSSPKGVMVSNAGIGELVHQLLLAFADLGPIRYLSLVPFSLLIEQVLALYLPLLSGGQVILKPVELPDFSTQRGHALAYLDCIAPARANCVFLPPRLLEEIAKLALEAPQRLHQQLLVHQPHILTGGANVSSALLEFLQQHGVAVHEGYGLSENSSVASLNRPGASKLGSVGKPLPHVSVRFENGELLIKSSSLCSGYLGTDASSCEISADGYLHTGDIGHLDDEGFLFITGRKKHVLVLSNTRNVCPEWVEGVYRSCDAIADLVVFGNGLEAPRAIIIARDHSVQEEEIRLGMQDYHAELPEYARVHEFVLLKDEAVRQAAFTVTGRPRRDYLIEQYQHTFS